jgi:DNA polymerase/3'-5' exonuclease PolX
MSKGEPISLASASALAEDFIQRMNGYFSRIEVAGSIRRKESIIHDIDLVGIPLGQSEELERFVDAAGATLDSFGEQYAYITFRETQINILLTTPTSWGASLMWATGPKGHQIGMNIKAKKLNLLFNPKGIWSRDEKQFYPTPNEHDICAILNWKFKEPELRGKK